MPAAAALSAGAAEEDNGLFTNRSTMLANFEEWIKMATDNKINSRNSWNFQLIDYFHDLSILKDSENNINFQKASATLDGCVKIYSSRVDSVSSETGKLLSGLAQRKQADVKSNSDEDGQDHDGANREEGEVQIDEATGLPISVDNGSGNTKRRVYNRVLETTLVEFDTIRLKELDQELNIDPLFKKALVDFDEGGAKSLLLNTLNINKNARVVFDATITDSTDPKPEEDLNADESDVDVANISVMEDDILALGMDYVNFELLQNCEISSSIQQLRHVVQDINQAKDFIDGVQSKFDNFLTEKELEEAIPEADQDRHDDGGDDDINNGMADELYYDDNGATEDMGEQDHLTDTKEESASAAIASIFESDLMAYFDETLKKTWRGRDHWKVRNFKKATTLTTTKPNNEESKPKKKKKEFEIDFFQIDDDLEETIFAPRQRKHIEMTQKTRTNNSHYLLPDDYQFTTERITRLFIKPRQKMSLFQKKKNSSTLHAASTEDTPDTLADEQFWAANYSKDEENGEEDNAQNDAGIENPFDDDNMGIDFNQAFEDDDGKDTIGEDATAKNTVMPDIGKLPLTDNKVSYSRVAKKVDVRKLKNNVWKSIQILAKIHQGSYPVELNFTDITKEIGKMYPEQTRKDLSTSFCFICLLHLANEYGLQISNTENYEDLVVTYNTQENS